MVSVLPLSYHWRRGRSYVFVLIPLPPWLHRHTILVSPYRPQDTCMPPLLLHNRLHATVISAQPSHHDIPSQSP